MSHGHKATMSYLESMNLVNKCRFIERATDAGVFTHTDLPAPRLKSDSGSDPDSDSDSDPQSLY